MQETRGRDSSGLTAIFEASLGSFASSIAGAPGGYVNTLGRLHYGMLSLFGRGVDASAENENLAQLAYIDCLEEVELGRRRLASAAVERWGSLGDRWNVATNLVTSDDRRLQRVGLRTLRSVLNSLEAGAGPLSELKNKGDSSRSFDGPLGNPVFALIEIAKNAEGRTRKYVFDLFNKFTAIRELLPTSTAASLTNRMDEIFDAYISPSEVKRLALTYARSGVDPRKVGVSELELDHPIVDLIEIALFVEGKSKFNDNLIESAARLFNQRVPEIRKDEKRRLVVDFFCKLYQKSKNAEVHLDDELIEFVQWNGQSINSEKISIYCAGIVLASSSDKIRERGKTLLASVLSILCERGKIGKLETLEEFNAAASITREQLSLLEIRHLLNGMQEPYRGWLSDKIFV